MWDSYARMNLAALFKTKTQAEWNAILLEGTDVCYGPVVPLEEAREHPHMKAREAYLEHEGAVASPRPRRASAARQARCVQVRMTVPR